MEFDLSFSAVTPAVVRRRPAPKSTLRDHRTILGPSRTVRLQTRTVQISCQTRCRRKPSRAERGARILLRPTHLRQFDQLYRQYGRLVYVRCRRMLGEQQAAEDATQEVFCRVATHLDRAPQAEYTLRWIYRISRNYCLNEIRNNRRRPQCVEGHEDAPDANAEALLVDRDLARRILRRTPTHLGAAAWLHCVDGLSHDEVGQRLSISRRTVINHVEEFANRARKFAERQS
jgi:RNA polymerase sigma-70 factor, ECF subfamily